MPTWMHERRMGDILHRCSFEYMKQHDARFDFRLAFYERTRQSTDFIRQGNSGTKEGSDLLKAEVEALLEQQRRKRGIQASEL